MKAAFIFLAILFTAHTSFAELRSILVEVIAHNTDHARRAPTVNIYSSVPAEQRLDTSIADAATVLKQTCQPFDSVSVSVLSFDTAFGTQDLLELLDGLKGNIDTQLTCVEFCIPSRLSDRAKALQAKFKIPAYTKTVQP